MKRNGMMVIVAAAALAALAATGTALAQAQPGGAPGISAPGIPPRTSATEADIWRGVRQGLQGQVSIPDKKAGVLIQSEGENWRNVRNGPVSTYGAWLLLASVVVLALFFAVRGRIRIEGGASGRMIERFGAAERFAHWLSASAFIVLTLTGLNMLYGRYILLPVIGPGAFATLTLWGKLAHNYIAFAFMVGAALMFVLQVRHNIPAAHDLTWLAKGGGLFTKGAHPPSRKFNAGQKVVFWSVAIGGVVLSVTGLYLLFPFSFGMDIHDMQLYLVLHAVVALVLTAVVLGHIYIGSIGMEGAFDAMGTGRVDENWAREHHNLWVAELKGEPAPGHDD